MATYIERFTAICNALVDGVATVNQQSALADAFVSLLTDEELQALIPGADRASLTNAQRAAIGVEHFLQYARNVWRTTHIRAAKDAAGVTAKNDALPL